MWSKHPLLLHWEIWQPDLWRVGGGRLIGGQWEVFLGRGKGRMKVGQTQEGWNQWRFPPPNPIPWAGLESNIEASQVCIRDLSAANTRNRSEKARTLLEIMSSFPNKTSTLLGSRTRHGGSTGGTCSVLGRSGMVNTQSCNSLQQEWLIFQLGLLDFSNCIDEVFLVIYDLFVYECLIKVSELKKESKQNKPDKWKLICVWIIKENQYKHST